MLTQLTLATVLASATGPTLENVRTELRDGTLTVEVTTSERPDADDLAAKIARGKLHLYFVNGRVDHDRRSFQTGGRTVEALPRAEYAKVEVPLAGATCHGDISFVPAGRGARAEVKCTETAAAGGVPRAEAVLGAAPAEAVLGTAEAKGKAMEATRPEGSDGIGARAASATAASTQAPAPHPLPLPRARGGEGRGEGAIAERAAAPPLTPAGAGRADQGGDQGKPLAGGGSSGPSSSFIGGGLLAVVGAAIFFMARKRAKQAQFIKIVETASLGPKRALVVAEVNGETLVLGSSEAGITFLRSLDGGAPAAGAAAPQRHTTLFPRELPSDGVDVKMEFAEDEPSDQASYLSKLFRLRDKPGAAPADTAADAAARAQEDRDFADLLAESTEDQSLRRRLASGLGGKVS
jgi:flagellar biogenesis protein FliO